MTIKKAAALILALALVFALAACAGSEKDDSKDLLARIKEQGYITIATEGDWAPWTYHDEKDELTGIDVELGRLIADGLGVEARFAETDWDSILAGVSAGRFDIACNGVGYTDERAKAYNFTDPYVYIESVLVTAADNEEIKSFEDLNGKTTANTASSTFASMAEEYGATVTPVNTLLETMLLVQQGRVDATINAKVSVDEYMSQHPDAPIKVVAVDEGETVVIPVQLGDDAASLHDEINKILADLRQSGKLSELSLKYFDADLTKKS